MDAAGENLYNTFLSNWIAEQFLPATSTHADDFAQYLVAADLTRTQVRNLFGELRRIEARGVENSMQDIAFLQHKLAYTKSRLDDRKRDSKAQHSTFKFILEKGLNAIPEDPEAAVKAFNRFLAYFEAVLAYHRYHGGKNG